MGKVKNSISEPCVLVDIDGTLADLTHRLHYIKDGRDWDSFFECVDEDESIDETIRVVNHLYDGGEKIILVSGRSSVCREKTVNWLSEHGVPYDDLRMRKEGDFRADTIIKEEILHELQEEGYAPWLAIDDRQRLARMWRKHGIMTYQCDDWEEREPTVAKDSPSLFVMVGPSGSGKTTWCEKNLDAAVYRVSSDEMRYYLTGDFADQTKNEQVFAACHGVTRSLLLQGVSVVFDATNIKNKDRKEVVNCAPEGTVVYYIVVDRPLEDKINTRGWRPEWLIEKHHQTMKSNIKDILKGDNFNVMVEDHRVS